MKSGSLSSLSVPRQHLFLFCLCAAVIVVASFLIRPIAWRPKWADSLVKKWNRKRTETPQPEAEQPPAADAE